MKKWIPNIYNVTELEQLEDYLEYQAAEGWILDRVGMKGVVLKKAQPQNLRYCVDIPYVHPKKGGSREYLQAYYEMCQDAGWTLVGTNTMIHVFVTDDMTTTPIHTDPNVRYEAVESYFRNQGGGVGLLLAIMVLLAVPVIPGLIQIGSGKALFFAAVLSLGMLLLGCSMYELHQWRRAHKQALITGDWKNHPKNCRWICLRGVVEWIFHIGVLVVDAILIREQFGAGVETVYDFMQLFLKPPLFGILLGVGAYAGVRFFYKRGVEADSARILGVAIALGLLAVLLWGTRLSGDDKAYKDANTTVEIQMGKIKEAPLTAEMLGIANAKKGTSTRRQAGEATSLEYRQYLENGGSLTYTYSLFKDELAARWGWESQYDADQYTVETESMYATEEWIDTDLSVLDTDNARVMKYCSSDGKTTEYRYIIQRGNVYLRLIYTEGLLTTEQLQVIAELLPSQ